MQFYLNGFYAGDPTISPVEASGRSTSDDVDVLIVGSGPAGLVLGAQLSRFADVKTRIVERKPGPMRLGQADGVQCRSIEMLEAFGLSSKILAEAHWVNETTFWQPSAADPSRITRTGRIRDVEEGVSEFPHVVVNQARVHDYLLTAMRRASAHLVPDYGVEFVDLTVDEDPDHPVLVTLRDVGTGTEDKVRTQYVVGCDGAHSRVRTAIGRRMAGDSANHAWGVMDILPITEFPDIRLKSAIQSSQDGNLLLIPREGGYLARFYVDLGEVTESNREAIRTTTSDEIVKTAGRILHPYTLESAETVWFSIYEVGQHLTDAFDDAAGRGREPRVFIAGDACHTHSAKAGQGMNVSMHDAFNLGWKLAAVLRGHAAPSLLATYSDERHPIAKELIDFDREWSAMMAAVPSDANDATADDRARLEHYYVQHARFTTGTATRYGPSLLTGGNEYQNLASGFEVGTRFHSTPVTRIADAKCIELGHIHRADGRWRLYLFADEHRRQLNDTCDWLANHSDSPIRRYTPPNADIDATIDVRAILHQTHRDVDVTRLPNLLRPRKGRFGLIDHEKAFSSFAHGSDAFKARGVDSENGVMILVRPDQHIALVLPLIATSALAEFLKHILI